MSMNNLKGALYGFAIGDAMGATTEFMHTDEIQKKYGKVTDIIGGGWLGLEPGLVTDDTQMTLCVCKALEETINYENPRRKNINFYERCCRNFVDWYDSNPIDIGNCCRNIISRCNKYEFKEWVHVANNPNSLGNGSLMRSMPVVLANQTIDTAIIQGRLTHNNKICDNCITEYYRVLEDCLFFNLSNTRHKMELMEPTGHVLNTLNNAEYWLFNTTSLDEAIIGAVNHGGDTDTIASITGSFVGAYYGFDKIPLKWINQLNNDVKFQLDHYADIFFPLHDAYEKHLEECNEVQYIITND